MDKKFEIVLRKDLKSKEKEIINLFWDFREEYENFYFLPKQLINEEYPTSRDVSKYVKENSYIVCRNLKCKKCQENLTFFSRKHYLDFWKTENQHCLKCFDLVIKEKAEKIISELKGIIYNFEKIRVSKIEELSFIHKLILYYIVVKLEKFEINKSFNIYDIFECDRYIFESIYTEYFGFLIKEKILILVDSNKVKEYWDSVWEDWPLIQQKVGIEKVREISRLYSFQYGVDYLINLAEEIGSYSEYSKNIADNINKHQLCNDSLKEIENFIVEYKLIQAKNLVMVIKNELKIPIDLASLKLEYFLLELVKKQPLKRCIQFCLMLQIIHVLFYIKMKRII
ncbi:hypothetical protein E0H86_04110 [Acinetobacter sp. ANC 4635]|uniref:hypothetical protein n=1 Tax=Acinetobacter sp. ANC 4635 TaxID=2529846 RepID=UPI00103D2769|nr:hypothetical protein [Acinetobacter sp. ANC 4635]TCB32650.1 hypothetical protein E0H86_04110 [Acinetobacter sp. ANC 4635]